MGLKWRSRSREILRSVIEVSVSIPDARPRRAPVFLHVKSCERVDLRKLQLGLNRVVLSKAFVQSPKQVRKAKSARD